MIDKQKEGFLVKFTPAALLENDRYRPNDFETFIYDNIDDKKLLKPKFDKKRQRSKSLRKLLSSKSLPKTNTSMHGNVNDLDLSLEDDWSTTETLTEFMSSTGDRETSISLHTNRITHKIENSAETMVEKIENCRTPECWFRFPKIVTKLLCIPRIERISQLKQYNTHCRHCPKKVHKCRTLLHNLLDNEKYSKLSYSIQVFIMSMILLSTLAYIFETIPIVQSNETALQVFTWIEYVVSVIFTVEYLLRIISSRNICVFFWDVMNIIDFVAIIPFWIEIISGAKGSNALRVIRVIRLARVFRLMKSPRFAEYMAILQSTIINSVGSFGLFLTLIFLEIIIASSLVYVCEAGEGGFTSIPATSWWAFVTVTTIGYGDMVPSSVMGRIICVITLFSGLLVIALPVIIIGGNFEQEYQKYLSKKAGWSSKNMERNLGVKNKQKVKQIKTVARLLHFINHQQCKDIFEWEDVRLLYDEGLDSFEIINRILMFEHGHVYLPMQFTSYKKYALCEFYGKNMRLRKIQSDAHKHGKNNYHNYNNDKPSPYPPFRRTQSQPPPSTMPVTIKLPSSLNDEEHDADDEMKEIEENINNNMNTNHWSDIIELINAGNNSSSSASSNDGYQSGSVTAYENDKVDINVNNENDTEEIEEKKEKDKDNEEDKIKIRRKKKEIDKNINESKLLHSQSSRVSTTSGSGYNNTNLTRSNSHDGTNNNKHRDHSYQYNNKFVVSDD